MYFSLSRVAFWLAALSAAWAAVAPRERVGLAVAVSICSGLLAFGCRQIAERLPAPTRADTAPPATPLDVQALREAAALLPRRVRQAASFEGALHEVGRLLRNELGALQVSVCEVHAVGAVDAIVAELIEAQPGFRAVPRRVRLDTTPLGYALRCGLESAELPSVVVPVSVGGKAVAAIELGGVDLALEPVALVELLRVARLALSERADTPKSARPTTPDAEQVEPIAHPLRSSVYQVGAVSGMLGVLATPVDRDRKQAAALDCHDRLRGPTQTDEAPHMLSMPRADHGPDVVLVVAPLDADIGVGSAGADGLAATSSSAAQVQADPLDPRALANLAELDPTGQNHLLGRVMRAFQTSSARLRGQAAVALAKNDRAALRLALHTLKSSSAAVGALHLSKLCAALETRIRLEEPEPLESDMATMEIALDDALQAIARLLERNA